VQLLLAVAFFRLLDLLSYAHFDILKLTQTSLDEIHSLIQITMKNRKQLTPCRTVRAGRRAPRNPRPGGPGQKVGPHIWL